MESNFSSSRTKHSIAAFLLVFSQQRCRRKTTLSYDRVQTVLRAVIVKNHHPFYSEVYVYFCMLSFCLEPMKPGCNTEYIYFVGL